MSVIDNLKSFNRKERSMESVIDRLQAFNRKERFYLVGWALGKRDFQISPEFRKQLSEKLALDILETPFCAMDYHLDWIYASLFLKDTTPGLVYPQPSHNELSATQEDVDLLVAFEDSQNVYHIIMIEAKGDTSWTNKQLKSKVNRLDAIFTKDRTAREHVAPHFLFASPNKPVRINDEAFPSWMRPNGELLWMPLKGLEGKSKITRCNRDGKKSQFDDYWTVERV